MGQSVPGDDDDAQVGGAGACRDAGTNVSNPRAKARRQDGGYLLRSPCAGCSFWWRTTVIAILAKVRADRTGTSVSHSSVRNGGEGRGEEALRNAGAVRISEAPLSPALSPFVPHGARETDALLVTTVPARNFATIDTDATEDFPKEEMIGEALQINAPPVASLEGSGPEWRRGRRGGRGRRGRRCRVR